MREGNDMRRMAVSALAAMGLAALTFMGNAWAQTFGGGSSGAGGYGGAPSASSSSSAPPPGTAASPGSGGPTQASGAGGPTAQGMNAPGPNEIAGRVKTIDRGTNTLTLGDGRQLTVTPDVGVTKNGYGASPSDIERGDDVRASFTPGSTTNVQKVEVISPPGTFQPGP
jgi:hypothetical protein